MPTKARGRKSATARLSLVASSRPFGEMLNHDLRSATCAMRIFYSPMAEATPEASAPPLLWESPTLASAKQLAARENSI
ncbi:hypothetical protein AZE42_05005 [Rhizopogon vesiculosus]|uniref:Uncharacterized protein n=1 Tax=Rhizopogon vesiculosus TaxID=180088 RepID=A0A1J8PR87_9AGAM|nr:hypothetical protein AZE42_05005 [Rhizopogon vesiculosus]